MKWWLGLLGLFSCSMTSAKVLELYTETFPPYNFSVNSQLAGINTDLITEACERAKIECNISLLPWKRAYRNAQLAPNRGVFSTSRTPQREEKFIWVGPLASSYSCIYRLRDREDIKLESRKALRRYTIGIPRGDIYESVLKNIGLVEYDHYLTYAKKNEDIILFENGKLDLIIGSSLTLGYQLSNVDLTPKDVVPVLELEDKLLVGNFLALNKNTSPDIISDLQTAIDELKAEKYIERLVAHYVDSQLDQTMPVAEHLKSCLSGEVKY
ncbi:MULTISPECIES: substrate-binding periplasmic protein [unclassified Pseudoalteromonas]|uniref:substrate-binding periplasmic protein n=1 Tax=unclassified Pseudoalteromonas TaxID=194690 RepID=UPI0030153BF3